MGVSQLWLNNSISLFFLLSSFPTLKFTISCFAKRLCLIPLAAVFTLGCTHGSKHHTSAQPSRNEPITAQRTSLSASPSHSRYPQIIPDNSRSGKTRIRYKFTFEQQEVSFSLKVDDSIIEGARAANKYALSKKGRVETDWKKKFNLAFIEDTAQQPFLNALHKKFKKLKKKQQLDDDRFIELIVAFVQQIPYDTTEGAEAKFPIEIFVDKQGDCDDKSRLLVALLMRSNFRVATLHFDTENHMAVGIKSNGLKYKSTGYSYIETTSPSMIGFPFAENATVKLTTIPTAHPVGKGKKKYRSAPQIEYLVKTMKQLEKEIKSTQKKLAPLNEKCADAAHQIKKLEKKISRSTNSTSNSQTLKRYNEAVDTYNDMVSQQQNLAKKINKKIEVRNYIASHHTDRFHTYKWVKKKMKP